MKNGFTLIELLAVIVILAIILLIALPAINGIIAGVEKSSFENSAKLIVRAGLMKRTENELKNNLSDMTVTYENGEATGQDFDYNGSKPDSGTITVFKDGQVELAINNGKWCAIKKSNEKDITVIPFEEGTCVLSVLTCPGVEYTDISFGNGIKAYADGDSLCLLGKEEFKKIPTLPSELSLEITDFILDNFGEAMFQDQEALFIVAYVAYFNPQDWVAVKTGDYSFFELTSEKMNNGIINPEEVLILNPEFEELFNTLRSGGSGVSKSEEVDQFLVNRFSSFNIDKKNEVFAIIFISYAAPDEVYDAMIAGDNSVILDITSNIENGYMSIDEVIATQDTLADFILSLTFLDNGAPFVAVSAPSDAIVIKNFFPDENVYKLQEFTKVTIRGDIEEIGNFAFSGSLIPDEGPCDEGSLLDIAIESNITKIGNYAFYCNSITDITMPDSISLIGDYAFVRNKITGIDLPNNLKTISIGAFGENLITELDLPNGVLEISDYAFDSNPISSVDFHEGITYLSGFGNTDITSVTIPSTVAIIGESAFREVNLTDVTLPNSILEIRDYAFNYCGLTEIDLPDNLTYLSGFGSNNISSLMIPNTVTQIGEYAFDANNLSSLTLPTNLTVVGDRAFRGNAITSSIELPVTIRTIGVGAFESNSITGEIDLPDTLVSIGNSAFRNNNITSVQLTGSVTTYSQVFESNDITSLIVPEGVEDIHAFSNNNISSLSLPSTLKSISGFDGNNLTIVIIPEGVQYISTGAFKDNNLTSVSIPTTVIGIGYEAFENNTGLVGSISLPNIETIGIEAFAYCRLTSVDFGTKLREISARAFVANRLSTITLPDTLTYIGTNAFSNNTMSGIITIPGSVIYIGDSAFEFNALTGVVIQEGVKQIGSFTFRNNQLTNITLPSTITNIYSYAFNSNRLVSITFNRNSDTSIGQNAFYYNGPTGSSTSSVLHCTSAYCSKVINAYGTWNYVTNTWVKQ